MLRIKSQYVGSMDYGSPHNLEVFKTMYPSMIISLQGVIKVGFNYEPYFRVRTSYEKFGSIIKYLTRFLDIKVFMSNNDCYDVIILDRDWVHRFGIRGIL